MCMRPGKFYCDWIRLILRSAIVIYKKKGIKELVSYGAILGIATFPVVWIIASAQPTIMDILGRSTMIPVPHSSTQSAPHIKGACTSPVRA